MATLTASLLRRRPQAVMGSANMHSLHWAVVAASSLALTNSGDAASSTERKSLAMKGTSQALEEDSRGPNGAEMSTSEHQSVRAFENYLLTDNWQRERMERWRSEVAPAEAKNAGSASDAARRTP